VNVGKQKSKHPVNFAIYWLTGHVRPLGRKVLSAQSLFSVTKTLWPL